MTDKFSHLLVNCDHIIILFVKGREVTLIGVNGNKHTMTLDSQEIAASFFNYAKEKIPNHIAIS